MDKYDRDQIAKELIATALNKSYYGNALYVTLDFPELTNEEKKVIQRYLKSTIQPIDHVRLQEIAIKIKKGELNNE